jgi:hypothetical protein
MKLQKCYLVLILTLAARAQAMSQCPSAYLTPVLHYGGLFGGTADLVDYRITKSDETIFLQYIEEQSRDPGYQPAFVVSLVRNNAGIEAVLIRRSNAKNSGNSIEVIRKPVSVKAADQMRELFSSIIAETHYPVMVDLCPVLYTHGYYAQAFIEDSVRGSMAGEVFSPSDGSRAAELVAAGRLLRAYLVGGTGALPRGFTP